MILNIIKKKNLKKSIKIAETILNSDGKELGCLKINYRHWIVFLFW